ncbi:hypothetical protein MAPG_01396 [Magnaporthiopsis poae ATCC 64411]|uniref:Uncharacterized protein n=1 Tax=Magnaporthiopsis poae (strain ATCC 64411 / 73-15) TaxID=644358 RepID=A0A0C4DNK4_MAGP6|nr:hypothetical protein MAPG_01396 [Magnaporthiopsis poae ATCC 64411]
MPSQRPFFLSTVFAAFRQQTATPSLATGASQPNKQTTSSSYSTAATAATTAAAAAAARSWYIGGRTAAGEERFFKLGVMRRVRSNDRLSLDKLSL